MNRRATMATFRSACESRLVVVVALALASLQAAAVVQAQNWATSSTSPQGGTLLAFVAKSDGNLFSCEVIGSNAEGAWTATSHGMPGAGAVGQVSLHYGTNMDLYVFTRTASGNLFLRSAPHVFNNGNPQWAWTNLGNPAGTTI